MGLPVKFVFSHDSIGIGTQRSDAPAGRDPGVAARDAQHAGAASRPTRSRRPSAGRSRSSIAAGPSTLVFARQALPHVRTHAHQRRTCRGAAPTCWPRPTAARARSRCWPPAPRWRSRWPRATRCRPTASPTAVVSMPSWELFDAQDAAYRASVLGPGTRARRRAKRRCASAGTASSASAAASSA